VVNKTLSTATIVLQSWNRRIPGKPAR